MELNKIYLGDNIETLKTLPDESVDCCITSPPYYALRDYGTGTWVGGDPNCPHKNASTRFIRTMTDTSSIQKTNLDSDICEYVKVCPDCGAIREDKQVGIEETPEKYIERLVTIFHEVKRVLKNEGTLWVNIGDSYWGGGWRNAEFNENSGDIQKGSIGTHCGKTMPALKGNYKDIKSKDLIGIPWMLAFALRNDGWYLRQDIIWHKPNPMPESVKDRCTKSHEYIFLLSKSPKYYFDYKAIQEPCSDQERTNYACGGGKVSINADRNDNDLAERSKDFHPVEIDGIKVRNKRDVWDIANVIYANSKYIDAEQESSVRCGMNKMRGEHFVYLRKNLPSQSEFVNFMRNCTNVNKLSDALDTPRTTIEHWFRTDSSGFSYPSIQEWEKLREILNDGSDDFTAIDIKMTDISCETDDINKNVDGIRNKRDVWSVIPSHYKEAHFATFPEELVMPMLLAGCPKDGVVLDPFMGSGTTAVVAKKNHRNYIGCELNEEYVKMAENRINTTKKRLF